MALISGLRRWVSLAAALSLAVTVAALVVALAAAAGTHASSRELSQRLVPAAAASGVLLGQYTAQQTSLRDYVTSGRAAALAPFQQAAAQIPGQQDGVAGLVRRLSAAAAAARGGRDGAAGMARESGPARARGGGTRRFRAVRGRCRPISRSPGRTRWPCAHGWRTCRRRSPSRRPTPPPTSPVRRAACSRPWWPYVPW